MVCHLPAESSQKAHFETGKQLLERECRGWGHADAKYNGAVPQQFACLGETMCLKDPSLVANVWDSSSS